MSNFAYLFVIRNMGNGYSEAYPECPFWKNWIFNRFLKPIADANLEKRPITRIDSAIQSDVCQWRNYYILKYQCLDDKCASDPFAKGRSYLFKMYIILEKKPDVLPVERFNKFIEMCIKTGYEVVMPGSNNNLKIPIPDEFFNNKD